MTFPFALLAVLALPGFAGESGKAPNEAPKAGAPSTAQSAVQRVAFVSQLIDWAREEQSVEGLITAAQIVGGINLTEYQATKTAEPIKGVAIDRDKDEGKPVTLDATALLKEAQWYASASPDKRLKGYVDSLVKIGVWGQRGAEGGPKYAVTKANAQFTDIYDITFTGGDIAEIAVAGDGDTDLDLWVYDEFNNYIASDTGGTDNAYVSWTPRWTGKFRVEVRNPGLVHNQYVFITN